MNDPDRALDCLGLFASALALAFNVLRIVEYLDPLDPYRHYIAHPGIFLLSAGAMAANAGLIAGVVLVDARRRQPALLLCALASVALPWAELGLGERIYYGEVRDKQGLPWSLSNFGPIGSLVFALYAVWRFDCARTRARPVRVALVRVTLSALVGTFHLWLFQLPWEGYRS